MEGTAVEMWLDLLYSSTLSGCSLDRCMGGRTSDKKMWLEQDTFREQFWELGFKIWWYCCTQWNCKTQAQRSARGRRHDSKCLLKTIFLIDCDSYIVHVPFRCIWHDDIHTKLLENLIYRNVPIQICTVRKYVLWFNFVLGLNFMFLCFWVSWYMIMSLKQRKRKFEPRIKLNHNMYTCQIWILPLKNHLRKVQRVRSQRPHYSVYICMSKEYWNF